MHRGCRAMTRRCSTPEFSPAVLRGDDDVNSASRPVPHPANFKLWKELFEPDLLRNSSIGAAKSVRQLEDRFPARKGNIQHPRILAGHRGAEAGAASQGDNAPPHLAPTEDAVRTNSWQMLAHRGPSRCYRNHCTEFQDRAVMQITNCSYLSSPMR